MLAINVISYFLCFSTVIPIGVTNPEQPELQTNAVDGIILALDDQKQSLIVASDVVESDLNRSSYAATTTEEVAAKKAEEARRAAQEAYENQRKNLRGSGPMFASFNAANNVCNGAFCWPVSNFSYNFSNNAFMTAQRPNHQGFDMMTSKGTPIVSVADGVVRLSQESYGGFGVAVVVDSVIDGQQVSFTYGHMTYGTRAVQAGDRVVAGQLLGRVGDTGHAYGDHLHIEIRVNGNLVDPYVWLVDHAGSIG